MSVIIYSLLPVSTELLLQLVSGKEHDRSLLNRLCKSHEIPGQASSLELLSPQTFPSLFIFQPVFFFMLSLLFHPWLWLGFSPRHSSQIPESFLLLSAFLLPLLFPSFPGAASGEEGQLDSHSPSRFSVLLLSHYVYLEGLPFPSCWSNRHSPC